MAYRQYIGARYVPLYAGRWDATKNYEPLTVVDDANGNSYTSKKDVPAGTALDNREYWIQTASFSGAITQLQNRMNTAEEEIDELQSKDTRLLERIETIETKVNKKYLFLGDSYYLGGTGTTITGNGWAHKCVEYMQLAPSEKIMATEADIVAGSATPTTPAFYATAAGHRSFATILNAIASRIGLEECASVTDIVVAGGYNDIGHISEINAGIASFKEVVDANFPNAQVHVAEIAYNGAETSAGALDRIAILDSVIPEYQKCVEYGFNYIGNAEKLLTSGTLFDTPAHPNNVGYALIGRTIANALMGIPANVNITERVHYVTGNAATGWSVTDGEMKVITGQYGKKRIECHNVRLTKTENVVMEPLAQLNIPIKCDGMLLAHFKSIQTTAALYAADGTYINTVPVSVTVGMDGTGTILRVVNLSGLPNITFRSINFKALHEEIDSYFY